MQAKKEIVKKLLKQSLEEKDEEELIELLIDNSISVDTDKEIEVNATFGDRLADAISEKAGSWGFILGFTLFIVIWIILNLYVFTTDVDPYPFILLNLILSCIAALQAPIIMMSQNRQSKKDSMRSHNDYRVDLKSELILEELHNEISQVLKNQNKILAYLKEDDEE